QFFFELRQFATVPLALAFERLESLVLVGHGRRRRFFLQRVGRFAHARLGLVEVRRFLAARRVFGGQALGVRAGSLLVTGQLAERFLIGLGAFLLVRQLTSLVEVLLLALD